MGGVINGDTVVIKPGARVAPGDGLRGGMGVGATMLHWGTLQQLSVGSWTRTQ